MATPANGQTSLANSTEICLVVRDDLPAVPLSIPPSVCRKTRRISATMRFAFHEHFSISFKKYSRPTWANYRRSAEASRICTGEAANPSVFNTSPLAGSTWPNCNTPVGHDCTQALQRTHSGSAIGKPLLAKFMTSMPWWHTEVQTLQEMHFFLSARMRKRLKRA